MINIIESQLKDVKIIEPQIFDDNRGYFFESYNQKEFVKKIGEFNFIQDNESKSSFGVLRGMHYQKKPYEQSKLIRVVKGEIQDVVIDLRKESPYYLKHASFILNDKNKKQIFIPKGFAHGFLVISKYAIVNYKVDNFYNANYEFSIPFNHPNLKINWKIDHKKIIISDKDKVKSANVII